MARAEGLSYGRYVYIHAAELAGKPPKRRLRPGERVCRSCGRIFMPANNQQLFCRAACRVTWNKNKRKRMKETEDAENVR